MTETAKITRLGKAATEFNVALQHIVEYLKSQGFEVDMNPNFKITEAIWDSLLSKFQPDRLDKLKATNLNLTPNITKEDKHHEHKTTVAPPEIPKPKPTTSEEVSKEPEKENPPIKKTKEPVSKQPDEESQKFKVIGKVDLDTLDPKKAKAKKKEVIEETIQETAPVVVEKTEEIPSPGLEEKPKKGKTKKGAADDTPQKEIFNKDGELNTEDNVLKAKPEEDLRGLNILGTIDLKQFEPKPKKPVVKPTTAQGSDVKKPRTRKPIPVNSKLSDQRQGNQGARPGERPPFGTRPPADDKKIQEQVKNTLNKLYKKQQSGPDKSRLKKKKRDIREQRKAEEITHAEEQSKVLQVTEFVTVNELANMMNVPVTNVIMSCMSLGLMVSINQRLDAETITVVADEFGYDVNFREAEMDEPALEEVSDPENITDRPPIVTIMGHVDHGKTSLLDYIRNTNVVAGEAGGITQHIGAYEVTLENGKQITFLDTPGHEAFTAMRARGAKVTDIAIIVIAADDAVMPQTKEAISHAQAAGVPIVFAFNKIDKEGADSEKIRKQLAEMNILVEEWGGKYQTQEIAAKKGINIPQLLDKVLLEAEMLDLKADPVKRAVGTVIEASLDKGKGIVVTMLVENGTIKIGDPMLAGSYFGKVKAMYNERGTRIESAGPSSPVQVLGFEGSPTAGDRFYVTESEQQGKEIATKRKQLVREQGIRTKKHITLDEIGRRLAIGSFKELNLIIKGDVDGSVEALSDSLLRLSNEEIQVNVIFKSVGQITESDVLLASASDAIIIGFQVRPSISARKMAEAEQIDIRLYSIIYNAIEEITSAMEGMLAPALNEKIVSNVEIREVFKITKVGTVAGCYVLDGRITRNTKIRIVRDGVVVFTGELSSLKRFKDDVKEVSAGYECGLTIHNFNDIKVGDIVEGYEITEEARKLTF